MKLSRTYRKSICLVLTGLLTCNLSSCMLFPDEKTTRKVTYVSMDKLSEYETISPQRQDIDNIISFSCVYKQFGEQELKFQLAGKRVETVYVKEGDKVKKGSLLASLQIPGLDEEIKSLEDTNHQLKQSINELKEQIALEKEMIEVDYKYKIITKAERDINIKKVENSMKAEINTSNDQIYIQNLKLKEKKKLAEGTKLYAPEDGVITYVKDRLLNSTSESNITVIKLLGSNQSAFEVYTGDSKGFIKEGQKYTVDCEEVFEDKIVTSSYEGTIKMMKVKDSKGIYLKLDSPSSKLQVGQSGTIKYLVEHKQNVITLPRNIIHEGENFDFVYLLDKDKNRVMNKVELGIKTNEYAEIVKGLKDDDLVVIED